MVRVWRASWRVDWMQATTCDKEVGCGCALAVQQSSRILDMKSWETAGHVDE